MVEHAREVTVRFPYETAEHGTAAKLRPAESRPEGMRWRDIHDGDATLGQRFRKALERLERLCYAVYGARPVSYGPFVSWEHRLHPRCLWQPEQWAQEWCPDIWPDCSDFNWDFFEYAASGDSYQWRVPRPSVPIRSRSGDWKLQALDESRPHDRTYFPALSVVRQDGQVDYHGRETYDPRGTGYFGGNPAKIGHHGPREFAHEVLIEGDPVQVTYTVPAQLVAQCAGATLYWNGISVAMTQASAGTWKASIPAQAHDTLVRWYLRATFQPQGDPLPPQVVRYEPGGLAQPTPEQQYAYVAFSHWNPYPHGLPELWSKCAKGTDRYEFTEDETIQPALINLARFVLDYIGLPYHHSPRLRSQLPICCIDFPIKFRWSGSAPWPHYVHGGKDEYLRPLHNLSQPGGGSLARRSWRGAEQLWGANPHYGPGASWLSVPFRIPVQRSDYDGPTQCKIHWTGSDRGLQAGDVIDAVHIEEIIAAVDYLVRYGLWTKRPIKRRVMTTTGVVEFGLKCGQYRSLGTGQLGEIHAGVGRCCAASEPENPCIPFSAPQARADGRTAWQDCWNNYEGVPGYLNDSEHPEWRKPPFGVCTNSAQKSGYCYHPPGGSQYEYVGSEIVVCNGGPLYWDDPCNSGCGYGSPNPSDISGCGCALCWWIYVPAGFEGPEQWLRGHRFKNCGWSAWVCGPQQAVDGPDALHGNASVKQRSKKTCPDADPQATDTYMCAKRWDNNEHEIGFKTVTAVRYRGAAEGWINHDCGWQCDSSVSYHEPCVRDGNFPELPGMPDHWVPSDWDDPSQQWHYSCGFSCEYISDEFMGSGSRADGGCSCRVNSCSKDEVWVALDLNVDGHTPYGSHRDYPIPQEGEPAPEFMPNLYDYDPSPDPAEFPLGLRWTNCPLPHLDRAGELRDLRRAAAVITDVLVGTDRIMLSAYNPRSEVTVAKCVYVLTRVREELGRLDEAAFREWLRSQGDPGRELAERLDAGWTAPASDALTIDPRNAAEELKIVSFLRAEQGGQQPPQYIGRRQGCRH